MSFVFNRFGLSLVSVYQSKQGGHPHSSPKAGFCDFLLLFSTAAWLQLARRVRLTSFRGTMERKHTHQ